MSARWHDHSTRGAIGLIRRRTDDQKVGDVRSESVTSKLAPRARPSLLLCSTQGHDCFCDRLRCSPVWRQACAPQSSAPGERLEVEVRDSAVAAEGAVPAFVAAVAAADIAEHLDVIGVELLDVADAD